MSATQNITFTDNDWYNKIAIVDTARVMVKSDENVPIGKFIAARFKVGTSQGSLRRKKCLTQMLSLNRNNGSHFLKHSRM